MHDIEPYYSWIKYYDAASDDLSPFFGKEYNQDLYQDAIYNYFIDPNWDYIGSETLYIKILYADYEMGYAILELIGEWNDAISNDIMYLKRNVTDHLWHAWVSINSSSLERMFLISMDRMIAITKNGLKRLMRVGLRLSISGILFLRNGKNMTWIPILILVVD
jgi:hypothetical protein